jgi:hypothetical protein
MALWVHAGLLQKETRALLSCLGDDGWFWGYSSDVLRDPRRHTPRRSGRRLAIEKRLRRLVKRGVASVPDGIWQYGDLIAPPTSTISGVCCLRTWVREG